MIVFIGIFPFRNPAEIALLGHLSFLISDGGEGVSFVP